MLTEWLSVERPYKRLQSLAGVHYLVMEFVDGIYLLLTMLFLAKQRGEAWFFSAGRGQGCCNWVW